MQKVVALVICFILISTTLKSQTRESGISSNSQPRKLVPIIDEFERLSNIRLDDSSTEENSFSESFWGPEQTILFDKSKITDYSTYCLNLLASSKYQELKEIQDLRIYLNSVDKKTLEQSPYFEKHLKWSEEEVPYHKQFEYASTLMEEVIHAVVKIKNLEPRILRNLMISYNQMAPLSPENSLLVSSQYLEYIYQYGLGQIIATNGKAILKDSNSDAARNFIDIIWLTGKFEASNPNQKLLAECFARNFSFFLKRTQQFLVNSQLSKPSEGEWRPLPLDIENIGIYGKTDRGTPFNENFISYALVKKLASTGAIEFELPDKLKETYPTLKSIKAQDYINYLSSNESLGVWKTGSFTVIYKNWEKNYSNPISPCLQIFFDNRSVGTNTEESRRDFELWSLFDFSHPFDYFKSLKDGNNRDLFLEIELKDDKLVSSLVAEPLVNYNYWDERFKNVRANKENLTLESQNAVNQIQERINDFETSVNQFIENFEKATPILFAGEKDLLSLLEATSKGIERSKVKKHFGGEYQSWKFDSTPFVFSQIVFTPTHPYIISELEKSNGYSKVLANYLRSSNEAYLQVTKKIEEEAKAPFQTYLDKYYKDQEGEKFSYASLFDYLDSNFKLFNNSQDLSLSLAGKLVYDLPDFDYEDLEGRGSLTWSSGNSARLEGTIYPPNGSPITASYSGKISRTPDSDSNKESFPFLFTSSENEKFYLYTNEFECSRSLGIRGAGKNKNILFLFDFKK